MHKINLPISKRESGKFVPVGNVDIYVPFLNDFVAELVKAKQKVNEKNEPEVTEDGIPLFDSDIANYVQNAVYNAVKMGARNKLVTGTVELKPGLKIAENWDELTTEGTPGNGGAALALLRELRASFAEWVGTLGKSEQAQTAIKTLFNNKQALEMATTVNKGKMLAFIEQFAGTMDEADLERFARPLEAVLELCKTATVDDF